MAMAAKRVKVLSLAPIAGSNILTAVVDLDGPQDPHGKRKVDKHRCYACVAPPVTKNQRIHYPISPTLDGTKPS